MTKEIEKLCSEIKPEALRAYAESKGFYLTQDAGGSFFSRSFGDQNFRELDVESLSEAEYRPILAILYDLWKLQNPDEEQWTWLEAHLESNGLGELKEGLLNTLSTWRDFKNKNYILRREIDEKDKRIIELEIHLGALLELECCIEAKEWDRCKDVYKGAIECMQGMTPVTNRYADELKAKIAKLEAHLSVIVHSDILENIPHWSISLYKDKIDDAKNLLSGKKSGFFAERDIRIADLEAEVKRLKEPVGTADVEDFYRDEEDRPKIRSDIL